MRSRLFIVLLALVISTSSSLVASISSAATTWNAPTLTFSSDPSGKISTLVGWSAPAITSGSVTGYSVTATPSDPKSGVVYFPTSGTTKATSGTVLLVSGLTYSITVSAQISGGATASMVSSAASAKLVAPSTPTSLGVVAADQQLTVSWVGTTTASVPPTTSYTATVDPTHSCTTAQSSCVINGLTNLTAYTVSLTATNAVGSTVPVTKGATPYKLSAASNVTVSNSGSSGLSVSWQSASGNPSGAFSYVATAKDTSNNAFSCPSTSTLGCTITGLTPGTSYAVSVAATWMGQTVTSAQPYPTATVFNAPGAIVITAVAGIAAGSQSVNITWTAAQANGANVSSYVVKARDTSVTSAQWVTVCTVDATQPNPSLSCQATGLVNGDLYEIQVSASNGLTSQSSVQVTPYGPPSSPQNVAVSAGGGSGVMTVSWQAPSATGGSTSLKYTAEAIDLLGGVAGSCSIAAPATSCQITGLSNGSSYSARVKVANGPNAQSGYSSSATTSSNSVTVYGPPSSINKLLVTVGHDAGDGSIVVTWEAPAQANGMPLTGYLVTVTNQTHPGGGGTCSVGLGEALSCQFQGLTNGDTYQVSVVALNGQSSSPVTTVAVPYGAPGPITNAMLKGGFGPTASGSIKVSWTAASANGKAVSYTVTVFDDANQPVGSVCTPSAVGSTLTCIVTGLQNGKYYTATILATNGDNSTSSVTVSDAVQVFGSPEPVTSIAATAGPAVGSGKLAVTWNAPTNVNGHDLTSYVVWAMATSGSATPIKTCSVAPATATTCTIAGLVNGTAYFIKVWAYNGTDSFSSAMSFSSVSPFINPGVVSNVNVVTGSKVGGGFMTVSWNAPTDTGGKAITGYKVTLDPGNKMCNPDSTTTSCKFRDLQDGTNYKISVIAMNAVGSDSNPTVNYGTPYSAPDTATKGVVTSGSVAGSQTLIVSWTGAANGNGRDVEKYGVNAKVNGVIAGSCFTSSANSTQCSISGLTNGTNYTISIVTYNNFLNDQGSSATLTLQDTYHPYTAPMAPTSVTGVVGHAAGGNGKVKASWLAPSDNGGNVISLYTATALLNGTPAGACTSNGPTFCTISGLSNGSDYTIQVTATNGDRSTSPAASAVNLANPYGAPSIVRSVAWQCIPNPINPSICGSGELLVSWLAPSALNGRLIQQYAVVLTDMTANAQVLAVTTLPSVLNYDFTGLTNGHQYQVTVGAINSTGAEELSQGALGSPVSTANPFTIPKAPVISTITATADQAGSLTVTWTRSPGDDGGSPISSFRVDAYANGAGTSTARKGNGCSADGQTTSCILTGLQNGTTYSVQMYAKNAAGQGPYSSNRLTGTPNGPVSGVGQIPLTPADSKITAQVKNLNFGGGTPDADFVLKWDVALAAPSPCWIPVNYGTTTAGGPNTCDLSAFASTLLSGSLADRTTNCPTTYNSYSSPMYCVEKDVNNGSSYIMRVTIQNSYTAQQGRISPQWLSAPAMPSGPPKEPANVTVSLSVSTATISWNKSPSDGGSPILSYVVTSIPSNLQCVVTVVDSNTPTYSCQIEGLTLGLTYTFSVVAKNATGPGAAQLSPSAVVGAASAPTSVTAAPLDKGILVSWTQSAANGFPISLYTATAVAGNKSYSCTTGGANTPTLSCVIVVPNCVSGQTCPTYSVGVTAQNNVSGLIQVSPTTMTQSSVVVYGVPDAPTSVSLTALESSIVVKWLPPTNVGSGITMYVVTAVDQLKGGGTFYCTVRPPLPFGVLPSCTVGGPAMQIGHTFNVSVQAFDDIGGSQSTALLTATTSTSPVAPLVVTAIGESTDIVVTWNVFSPAGKNIATKYEIDSSSKDMSCPAPGAATTVVCTPTPSATPGTSYTFSVKAVNTTGKSLATTSIPTSMLSPLTETGGVPTSTAWTSSGGPGVLPTAGGVAFAPNGTMFTVGRLTQQVFSTAGNITIALPLTTSLVDPTAVATSADGSSLFIADAGANAIVTALANGMKSGTLPVTSAIALNGPNALAVIGNTLYISDAGNGRLLSVSTSGGAAKIVRSTSPLTSVTGMAALPNGNLLVVDPGNGGLVQLNPTTGVAAVLTTYDAVGTLYTTPDAVAVSPDGSTYFVSMNQGSNKYAVVEMSSNGGNMSSITSDIVGLGGLAMSSSGKLAYSAVRGVFTAQFRSTPAVPVVTVTPSKNGLVATWTTPTPWDGAWTYVATVSKATSPAGAPVSCMVSTSGCSVTGLSPSTKYVLTVTVSGAVGTPSVTGTYSFTTPAK